MNADELAQAEKGRCQWQTATYPRVEHCQKKPKCGHYCAEHKRDRRELYGKGPT